MDYEKLYKAYYLQVSVFSKGAFMIYYVPVICRHAEEKA